MKTVYDDIQTQESFFTGELSNMTNHERLLGCRALGPSTDAVCVSRTAV